MGYIYNKAGYAMRKSDIKEQIESNKETITELSSGAKSCTRLNNMGWMHSELIHETETLFQYPNYMPPEEKEYHLNYIHIGNLGRAWNYITRNKKTPIDHYQIRQLHRIVSKNTDVSGGEYRFSDAFIEQLQCDAPPYHIMLQRLDDIKYNINNPDVPVLIRAFNTHFDIIAAQPFNDFNKRVARLTMNWFLMQNNYTPIFFNKKSDNRDYMVALYHRAHEDYKAYSYYMYKCMLRTQKDIIQLIKKSRGM